MKNLSVQQGVDNTDSDFVNGKLVDLLTLVGEGINQDPIQFFQNLADLAGIVFNGLPDNDANGYQTVEALETVVRSFAASTILKGTVEKATTAEAQAGTAEKYIDAALLQLVTATETRKGIVEKATPAEVIAGTAEKFLDAALLAAAVFDTAKITSGVFATARIPNLEGAITLSPVLTSPWAYSAIGTHVIRAISRNVVHVSMSMFKGITGSANATLMVLAVVFRPFVKRYIRCQSLIGVETNSTPQTISIDTDGTVSIEGTTTTQAHVIYIEGLYYLD